MTVEMGLLVAVLIAVIGASVVVGRYMQKVDGYDKRAGFLLERLEATTNRVGAVETRLTMLENQFQAQRKSR